MIIFFSFYLCQGIPVACTPTGVKHLHHKALDFDIGVYFEANGHGTVIFSSNAENAIREAAGNERTLNKSLSKFIHNIIVVVICQIMYDYI